MPEGGVVNFLGVFTRTEFWEPSQYESQQYPANRTVATDYPSADHEYFEWIAVLEAVLSARDSFSMIDLGAGWGRWGVNAAVALSHCGALPFTCIEVEAEPTHFRWMAQHIADNHLNPENFRLIESAVASIDGSISFQVGDTKRGSPANWYGQSIGGDHVVKAVSLNTLLQPLTVVDLVDLDIQGAEMEVLSSSADELDEKVKRVHVSTHGPQIEEGLRSLFSRLGWTSIDLYPGSSTLETPWGRICQTDGIQTWANPTFSNSARATVLSEKLRACRSEAERLWVELQKARDDQNRFLLTQKSAAWKMIERGKRLRDRLAPHGSRRRKIADSIAGKL